ncbi:MAG: YibE/F family protein [bacterium]|nr:YibE/F family protein [bacterium]
MKKTIIFFAVTLVIFISAAGSARAQEAAEQTFKAEVIQILDNKEVSLTDEKGERITLTRQNLKLRGLDGVFAGQEFTVNLLDDLNILNKAVYRVGDRVLAASSADELGNNKFFITDFVRTGILFWLFIAFVISVLLVGRLKGLRSLISLALTFLIIIKFIIPRILNGADPVLITVIGSILILIVIIYLTEGINVKSNIAASTIFISLLFTVFLSWLLIHAAKLTGLSSEEAGFIIDLGAKTINLQGILLAGVIIGTLGALDDVIIAQVAMVEQLHYANPGQPRGVILKKAFNVGVSHISAMANTLFLAYAGAGLPLLILFVSGQSSFSGWDVALNNEMLATEIIRALTGTIGIVLSIPLATMISVWWFKRK